MKRIVSLGVVLITLIYVFPFVYNGYYAGVKEVISEQDISEGGEVQKTDGEVVSANGEEKKDREIAKIKVLVGENVQEMTMDDYIAGVVAAEMPASFPLESLKAQAVAARTYTMYKKTFGKADAIHKGADVCDNYKHCAAFVNLEKDASKLWGKKADDYKKKIEDAVKSTQNEIITYNNAPIAAVFHSASTAKTENALDVWGTETPYLKSVDSPGGEDCPKYSASVTFTDKEFQDKMAAKYPSCNLSGRPNTWFTASNRSQAGGIIKVKVGGIWIGGNELRAYLGLNSTNFKLSTTDTSITFLTTGYGHGVGLSQYGAKKMAADGKTYAEILTHYYSGTKIQKN